MIPFFLPKSSPWSPVSPNWFFTGFFFPPPTLIAQPFWSRASRGMTQHHPNLFNFFSCRLGYLPFFSKMWPTLQWARKRIASYPILLMVPTFPMNFFFGSVHRPPFVLSTTFSVNKLRETDFGHGQKLSSPWTPLEHLLLLVTSVVRDASLRFASFRESRI